MPRKIDLEHARKMRRYDLIGQLFERAIPWCGLVFIFFFAWRIAEDWAGRTTAATIVFKVLADLKTSKGIVILVFGLFGITGVGYGLKERNLRRKDTARKADYIRELEEKVDPHRTSSRLTKRGTTPKEKRNE